MIRIVVAVAAFWSYCGLMSFLAKRNDPVLSRKGVVPASVAIYLVLVAACTFSILSRIRGYDAIPFICGLVLALILGILLGYPYLAFLIGEIFDRTHASVTGIDGMKVAETYDQAGKAERERRFEDAIDLYLKGAAENPADPEPLRRMAEIHASREEWSLAITRLKEAYPRIQEAEEKASLAFRASDLMVRAGRSSEAREFLESTARDLAGTRFESYARARLQSL